MYKQQLIESLEYIKIKRGPSTPLPISQILEQRIEVFIEKRYKNLSKFTMERAYGSDRHN